MSINMTASSVEFFPCRVQLVGLPAQALLGNSGGSPPPSPPIATVQRISRNLFGTPQPGAISQLLRDENQRQRTIMLQRYNFDIKTSMVRDTTVSSSSPSSPSSTSEPVTSTTSTTPVSLREEDSSVSTQCAPLPSLIALELQDHEQRLEEEQCNLSRTQSNGEITASQIKRTASTPQTAAAAAASASAHSKRTTAAAVAVAAANAAGSYSAETSCGAARIKPYSRQTLLTECFNLRKSTQYNGKSIVTVGAGAGGPGIAGVIQSPKRRLEVLELSKPMRVIETSPNKATSTTLTVVRSPRSQPRAP